MQQIEYGDKYSTMKSEYAVAGYVIHEAETAVAVLVSTIEPFRAEQELKRIYTEAIRKIRQERKETNG